MPVTNKYNKPWDPNNPEETFKIIDERLRIGTRISTAVKEADGDTNRATNRKLDYALADARIAGIRKPQIDDAIEIGVQEFRKAKRQTPAQRNYEALRHAREVGARLPHKDRRTERDVTAAIKRQEDRELAEAIAMSQHQMENDRQLEENRELAKAIAMSQNPMEKLKEPDSPAALQKVFMDAYRRTGQTKEDRQLAEAISMSMEKPAKRKPPPPPNKPKHLSTLSQKMHDTYTASRLKTERDKASKPPTPPKNPRKMSAAATAALARQAQTLSTPRDKQMAERRQKDEIIGKIYAAYSSRHDAPPIGLPAASIKQLKEHLEKVRKRPAGGKRRTKKRRYRHPKKGRKSRTHKGRKDFTTKKTSKVFHRRKHYQRKSVKGVKRRPYHKKRK